jgi:chaperonin GroES
MDIPGGVLKDNIVPLPVPGPSTVLFQLLGMLNDVGMKLASVSDAMAGETPSQNTPATTTLAVIEQGLKVFTAIYKRIFRSLKSEFGKLRRLNSLYLDDDEVFRVLDEEQEVFREDYKLGNFDIIPVADPTMASDAQRLAKAQALMGTMQMNPTPEGRLEILEQFYAALQAPNMDKLIPRDEEGNIKMPQPPPDPKALELQLKTVQGQHEEERKRQILPLEMQKLEEEINEIKARTANYLAQAQDKPLQTALATINAQVAALQNETKMEIERLKAQVKGATDGTATGPAQKPAGGGVDGMAAQPGDAEGSGVPGGMPAGNGGLAVGGGDLDAEPEFDFTGDGAEGGADQGTQPYPERP